MTGDLAAERQRIHAQVRDSRRRQGLPEHVTDVGVLDRLAARLLTDGRPEHDDGPGSGKPGRRSTIPPPHTVKGPVQHATVP